MGSVFFDNEAEEDECAAEFVPGVHRQPRAVLSNNTSSLYALRAFCSLDSPRYKGDYN